MKVIEQDYIHKVNVSKFGDEINIYQDVDHILLNAQGAKQLIEILKEFVDEND